MGRKKSPHRRCRGCNKATANASQICAKCMEKQTPTPGHNENQQGARRKTPNTNGSYGIPQTKSRVYANPFCNKVRWFFVLEKLLTQSQVIASKRTMERFGITHGKLWQILNAKYKQEDGSLR